MLKIGYLWIVVQVYLKPYELPFYYLFSIYRFLFFLDNYDLRYPKLDLWISKNQIIFFNIQIAVLQFIS